MKEYKIVQAWGYQPLMDLVNELIAEGWQPIGGVAVAHLEFKDLGGDNAWAQAMVR